MSRLLAPGTVGGLVLCSLLTAGCQEILWPLDNPDDQDRCGGQCEAGQTCFEGRCVDEVRDAGLLDTFTSLDRPSLTDTRPPPDLAPAADTALVPDKHSLKDTASMPDQALSPDMAVALDKGLKPKDMPPVEASMVDMPPPPDQALPPKDTSPVEASLVDMPPPPDQALPPPDTLLVDQTQNIDFVPSPPPGTWKTLSTGSYMKGSPANEPCGSGVQTKVTIGKAFEIQTTEVTQAQFSKAMGYNPSTFKSCGTNGNCPVDNVSWNEAANYCNTLSKNAGLSQCYTCAGVDKNVTCYRSDTLIGLGINDCLGYRLPTPEEWEYAYRAGTTTAYYNGPIDAISCSHCYTADKNAMAIAWYCFNSGGKTHPVATKTPNTWGLYDMAGNVEEWCDGIGSNRVAKGGSYLHESRHLRAAYNGGGPPTFRLPRNGYRCVRTK